jgi:hypothetical protein
MLRVMHSLSCELCSYAVMVTVLPSSASWQDLKVLPVYLISYLHPLLDEPHLATTFRTICGELVMSVSLMYTARQEVSD